MLVNDFINMVSRKVVLSYFTLATFLSSVHRGRTQDEAPSFLKEPSSQIVERKSRVRLKCEFLPKDATVRWTFNGKPLDSTSTDEALEFRRSQLIIKSFQSKGVNSHAGDYRCFVQTSIGLIVSRTAKLHVAYIKKMNFRPLLYSSMRLGGTGVIPCTPPDSRPKAVVKFKFNGKYIENSGRHTILPGGDLHIHNVSTSDQGVYTCLAYNTILDKTQTADSGTNFTITSDPGDERSSIYATGASVFIGESTVLGCVSWGARVRWFRSEDSHPHSSSQLPDKAFQKWGNLYIENVRKHDMGIYTCKSYAEDGSLINETNVYLEVKIRPAIRNPPKDTSADPREPLSLKCSVVGDEDEIRWLFNTQPIDPLDTDYIVDGRQLKIRRLAIKHLGMYQCYVENELGSAQSSAEVKFSRGFEVPSFSTKPTNMTAIENELIFFECGITGKPTPFRYWLNPQGQRIISDRRFLIDGEPVDGGLSISGVRPQDSGWYTCIVKNNVGEDSSKAYLDVIEKRVDPVPTQYTLIPTVRPFEGAAVSDEAQTVTVNQVQRPVKNGAVPNRPGKAEVSEVTSSSMDIIWLYEDDVDAPVSTFYIQRLTVGLLNQGWENITDSIPSDRRMHRIINLTPGSTYRFRVVAANLYGSSEPGLMSNRFLVGEDENFNLILRPNQKPKITKCAAESTTSIIIEWEYKKELETQPVDGFYVLHRADRDGEEEYETSSIEDIKIARYVIRNLENDMLYDIKMQAYNVAGKSDYSNIMSVSTDAANVEAPPHTFMKPDYKPPGTPKSPIDEPVIPEETVEEADKEEILYICIGVVLGTLAVIFIMFAGMCIWRSKQPSGMFGAINWPHGYYGRAPPYSKGSQNLNNRYMNGYPGYDQQCNGGPHVNSNSYVEPRPLYMLPQDTAMPIDVAQYLSAEQNELNQNGMTALGSHHGTLECRHPSYVRPVRREDLKLTPNGIVCRPIQPHGNLHTQSNTDIHSRSHRDVRYYSNGDIRRSNGDIRYLPTNNEANRYVNRKASHNSLAHDSIAEDNHTELSQNSTARIGQQRSIRSSGGEASNEGSTISRSRSSSANSSQSTRSIVESDV